MEPLPHGLLVLSSSKPLTGGTGHYYRAEGRFSSTGTTGDTAFTGLSPYYRTRTHRTTAMTCLVGYTIEATHPAGTTTSRKESRKTPRRRQTSHRDCDSLRIAPVIKTTIGHTGLPGLPTTDINHRLLGMGTVSLVYTPFGNQPDYSSSPWSFHCLRFMYNPVLLVVHVH